MAALTQALVDGFLAAEKSVNEPVDLKWRESEPGLLRWDAPVECEAVIQGWLRLFFNAANPGHFNFNLQIHGHSIYGWHFRPFGKHRNFRCPRDFPRRAYYPHEQFWIEGVGFKCARPLAGLDGSSHEVLLREFCGRAHLSFVPRYHAPEAIEQTRLRLDKEGL